MQTFLVGGAVRDTLLGRNVTERDYVVVGATPQEMLNLGFTQVGSDFPVFLHPKTGEEYALARTERKSGKGYLGFDCDASATVTLEEDLLRRDLTVNAMALGNNDELIDPYNGKADLDNRLLRHVSPAFAEDPLRVFRVARFAARYHYLGFFICDSTLALMRDMANSGELAYLSAERIWQETKRSLLENEPTIYFDVLQHTESLKTWFNELCVDQTAIENGLKALAYVANQTAIESDYSEDECVAIRFSLLCHRLSTEQADALTSRLKAPNSVSDLLNLTTRFCAVLLDKKSTVDQILDVFNRADAWRRPQRFSQLLHCCNVLVATTHMHADTPDMNLYKDALVKMSRVDVQAIIKQGYKGSEIKQAIERERKNILNHSLIGT